MVATEAAGGGGGGGGGGGETGGADSFPEHAVARGTSVTRTRNHLQYRTLNIARSGGMTHSTRQLPENGIKGRTASAGHWLCMCPTLANLPAPTPSDAGMSSSEPHDVTDLLELVGAGDHSAADRLLSVVYAELRSLAASHMRRERPDHTLQATALVHEAWMRLVHERGVTWKNRSHFFGIATQAMRRVLLDHARGRGRRKRLAGERVLLGEVADPIDHDALDVLAVDEALQRLDVLDPRAAKVVELRFFGGLSVEETAEVLDIGTATVKRDWSFARAFLQRALDGDEAG